jgi:hypothetical protein
MLLMLQFLLAQNIRARICKRLWSPGIDSEKSIPPAYVACRVIPARQAENRFLGSYIRLI